MTDNEIIKAFEYCTFAEDCADCPLFKNCPSSLGMSQMALDLINRQKAEIERLNGCVVSEERCREIAQEMIPHFVRHARTVATKEFAERLCEGRVSNDPVVIAVETELKMAGEG